MSKRSAAPLAKLGTPVGSGPRTWVQTERTAHEQWASLIMRSPRAAALMHHFVALMGHQNAVVIPQRTLAKLMGCSLRTMQYALADLVNERWVQVVQLGPSATVNAYVINSNIAWGEKRDQRGRLAVFSAVVVGDMEYQPNGALAAPELRRVPVIFPPENALAVGDGEPGAQIALPGMEAVVVGPTNDMARLRGTVEMMTPLNLPPLV